MSFDPFDEIDLGGSSAETAVATMEAPVVTGARLESPVEAASPEVTEPKPSGVTKATRGKKSSVLYFDIETIPDLSRLHQFGLPEIPTPAEFIPENEGPAQSEVVLDTQAKTEAAVAAVVAKHGGKKICRKILVACVELEKKAPKPRKGVLDLFGSMIDEIDGESAMIAKAIADRNKAMSVCPEMCRICALGWAVGDDPVQSLVVGELSADGAGPITEADVLSRFWSLAASVSAVCGFNVLNFDLPTIFVRSVANKVKNTRKLDMKKYGSNDVLDLMALRYPSGGMRSLDFLTKANGIETEVPDVDGSKVFDLHTAGEFKKLGEYVRDDVRMTRTYHRMNAGFFW